MRFAPQRVKLRIANVRRFPLAGARPTSLVRKNHREIRYIRANCAVSKKPECGMAHIDENRPLPYKPRQLSAMARSDRGGSFWAGNGPFWAGQHHRTYPHSSGNLPAWPANCQRRTTREADLSTQQTGAQAPSRFSRPSGHRRRPQGPRRAPRARPQASERLSRAFPRTFIMDRLRQRADFLAVANGARANSAAFVVQAPAPRR